VAAPSTARPAAKNPIVRFEETEPNSPTGQYMRRFWQPVFVSENLAPGRAKPLHILGESFTLYRGESGTPHLTEFRCAHRGTQLSTGWVEGDDLRCLYHGWKYNAQGLCIEQPGEKRKKLGGEICIRSYPVQEYLGLIFCYLGPGQPPPFPRFRIFEQGGYLDLHVYSRDCNYFQNIENGVDEVHVNFTHEYTVFARSGLNDEVPLIDVKETPYGLVEYATRSGDNRVRETHLLMPNILLLKLPPRVSYEKGWRDYLSWRVPIDREVHMTFGLRRLELDEEGISRYKQERDEQKRRSQTQIHWRDIAKKVLAGDIDLRDVVDHDELVTIQDYVTQVGQGAVANREGERLGHSDVAVVLLRRLWQREVRAMTEGRPLTQWQIPDHLSATIGI